MISRRILAAVAVLCAIAAPAYAQKTKAQLTTEIGTTFPDNVVGAITPAGVRAYETDVINSIMPTAPVVSGNLACFNGTTGLLQDCGIAPATVALVVGTTPITGGATTNVLFNNGGKVGEYTVSGSGSVCMTTSCVMTSPNLDTPVAITLTNGTGLPLATGVLGTLPPANFGALTGDVTNSAGSSATTISASVVTNAKLATMTGPSIKGVTSGTATPSDLTPGQVGSILCVPNRQVFTSGTSQTYTTPTCNGVTATWLEVDLQGGGGGGSGSGTSLVAGTTGNSSSFGALTANGGGSTGSAGGAGGTCSGSLGTQQNFPGSAGSGSNGAAANNSVGGYGGVSFYGGGGAPGTSSSAGGAAPTNSGGGGAGGSGSGTAGVLAAAGGGAGCHIKTIITSPSATFTYTVGAAANGAAAGTSGFAGGAGAAGLLDVVAHWQ